MWNIYADPQLFCIPVSRENFNEKKFARLTHLGLRSFEMRNFGPYARNEKDNSRDFKRIDIIALAISRRRETRHWKTPRMKKTGPALVAMAKKQLAERRWKTRWYGSREIVNERSECFLFLSPSPSLSELNIKNVTRWMHELNINLRFPVAVCNATVWPFSRDVKLCKYHRSRHISWIKIHSIWSDFKFIITF